MSEISNPHVDKAFADFAEELLRRQDEESVGWDFANGDPGPPFPGEGLFALPEGTDGFFVIDPFRGRTPRCFNMRLLRNRDLQLGFRRGMILDSNAADRIRRALGPDGEPNEIFNLIDLLREHRLRPTPVFYLLESLAKSADMEKWTLYSDSTIDALKALDAILGVEAATEKRDRLIDSGVAHSEAAKIKRTYAALLKASVLGASSDSYLRKLQAFAEFLEKDLEQRLTLEILLAMWHWHQPGRFASMMTPLQAGANPDRALRKLQSTAWDLYLARLPEQLAKYLVPDVPDGAAATFDLYSVLTAERALAEFMSMRSVEMVIQSPNASDSKVFAGPDSQVLLAAAPLESRDEVMEWIRQWDNSMDASAKFREVTSVERLDEVIVREEGALKLACAEH